MLTPIDYVVLVAYVLGVALFGIWVGGKQTGTQDYFLGGRDLPWWAVCFSVVATETSTLTVIGVPAVAYGGTLTFFQLTFGYLLGRILVSLIFLPRYAQGQLTTAYAFLGARYGDGLRATASVTFLITRLLADGVRLFATAIPLKVIADSAGVETTYLQIIALIGIVTIAYTLIGGIKAVVWMDVVQMLIYIAGAGICLVLLLGEVPEGWWAEATEAGKTALLATGAGLSLSEMLTQPYVLLTAVVGGAVFSMASHGSDQLIVQRLLTCRTLADSQKALIGSAVLVMVQFALFLAVGLLLWVYYQGATPAELGLTRGDEVFPKYVIEGLPPGLSGLILAGIIAAAMSTLSSSLNSLASSTMMDLYERIRGVAVDPSKALRAARGLTFAWGLVFIGFATLFQDQNNPVVELGLAIASYTYGGLLGVFLLGIIHRGTQQRDAIVAFIAAIAVTAVVIFGIRYSGAEGWVFAWNPTAEESAARGLVTVGWPWYTVIGVIVTLAVGSLSALWHRLRRAPQAQTGA
ncbi:MAG: sodium:solute symporter [Bacteroidota bacterium]